MTRTPRYVSVGGPGKTTHLIPWGEVDDHDHNYDCACGPSSETGWDGHPFSIYQEWDATP